MPSTDVGHHLEKATMDHIERDIEEYGPATDCLWKPLVSGLFDQLRALIGIRKRFRPPWRVESARVSLRILPTCG